MEPRKESLEQSDQWGALGARVRDALGEDVPAAGTVAEGRVRFFAAFHGRRSAAKPLHRGLWILGGAVGALAAALVFFYGGPPAAVSFSIAGAGLGSTGSAIEASDHEVPLTFSEGSQVVVGPRARVRVVALERKRARVVLERGRTEVAIAGKTGRAWRFEAGSFAVTVLGTRFAMAWNPEGRSLDVTLHEGSLVVEGPCLSAPRHLSAGEQLNARCAEPVSKEVVVAPPPVPAAPRAALPAARPGVAPAAEASPSWRALAAAGRYREALAVARKSDFDRLCRVSPAAELVELGDAARLAGDAARAATALQAVRARFGGSPPASVAAFSLGRVAFEQRSDYATAARWFATYVEEQPQGPLAGDAWGRLMESRARAGQTVQARADARRYLDRYPAGPFAALARRLLE